MIYGMVILLIILGIHSMAIMWTILDKKRNKANINLVNGCYFCSKTCHHLVNIKAKLDGKIMEVKGCATCAEQLRTTGKVKVLHFLQGQTSIHWSKWKDGKPHEKYWSINQADKPQTHLRLIHSRKEYTDWKGKQK